MHGSYVQVVENKAEYRRTGQIAMAAGLPIFPTHTSEPAATTPAEGWHRMNCFKAWRGESMEHREFVWG